MVFRIEPVAASLVQGKLGHEGACPGKAVVVWPRMAWLSQEEEVRDQAELSVHLLVRLILSSSPGAGQEKVCRNSKLCHGTHWNTLEPEDDIRNGQKNFPQQ